MQISVLGIDLGKNSCSVVGLDVGRRKLARHIETLLVAEQVSLSG